MPKEALYWKPSENNKIECMLCPRKCIITEGKRGACRVRENQNGRLYTLAYGHATVQIDPIEKKPLFHFRPGSSVLSFGTEGCNLFCRHCQNWTLSQASAKELGLWEYGPGELVDMAVERGCAGIAYTYNEPTVFFEYMLETAKLARKKGLSNVVVSNGYINGEPLVELYKLIDGANIDLKGFSEKFYSEVCGAKLQPVLDTLKLIKEKTGTWLEITNLIIPTKNDDMKEIAGMCRWIRDNLGDTVPVHFTAFYPQYRMQNLPATPPATLERAAKTGKETGLKFVYQGNVMTSDGENTYCPECGKLLVERLGFSVTQFNIIKGRCKNCNKVVPGVWEKK